MSRPLVLAPKTPTLSRSSTLTPDGKSTTYYSLNARPSTSGAHPLSSHQVWIEVAPGHYVIHKVTTADANVELRSGRIPKEWHKRVERTLVMLITAATLYAFKCCSLPLRGSADAPATPC